MYDRFLTFIKDQRLFDDQQSVLLALSGGVDSMVMANLFLQLDCSISVAHVNYHLRGDQSDMDQALVEKWCRKHGKTCHVHHVEQSEYQSNESIQMVARRIRYNFFEELIDQYGYERIATAHNIDDNLETILLNLTKGTGISGLIGIAPKKERLIRPLLFATKAEVYDYGRANRVEWREDRSNQKSDYQRNRIRNHVIPELLAINPNLHKTFDDTRLRLKGTYEVFESTLLKYREFITSEGNFHTLDVGWVDDTNSSIVLLSELLKPFEFQFSQVKDISGSILNQSVGATFQSTIYTLNVDRDKLIIQEKIQKAKVDELIELTTSQVQIDDHCKLTVEVIKGNEYSVDNENVVFLDLQLLSFPLKLRQWSEGDRFQPLGMSGKKKVSDFMIDSKIPLTLKEDVLLLESAGQIAWIVGLRLDDRFKVTPQTSTMLKIQFARHV